MIIESSAMVAILLGEPERKSFVELLASAGALRMSSVSLLETSIVLRRKLGSESLKSITQFLGAARIEVVEFTANQCRIAFEAYGRYGKGTGHPAQLNILDCCSYALAIELQEPLLFKGADFVHTEVPMIK